jgi:hypothetical protein
MAPGKFIYETRENQQAPNYCYAISVLYRRLRRSLGIWNLWGLGLF